MKRPALYAIAFIVTASLVSSWFTAEYLSQGDLAVQQALVDMGMVKPKVTSDDKVLSVAPDLQLDTAVESGATAAGAVKVATEYVPVEVPYAAYDGSLESIPIELSATFQGGAVLSPSGGIFVRGRLFADVVQGEWSERVDLPIANTEMAISGELDRALRYYASRPPRIAYKPRRLKHWRAGWSVGAGLCRGLQGEADLCGAVVWGVQF